MSKSKGVLLTEMSELHYEKENVGLGMITPENIAKCVEFLLSEDAKHITGELMTIGSGMAY